MTIVSRRRVYWGLCIAACLCLAAFFVLYGFLLRAERSLSYFATVDQSRAFRLGSILIPAYRLTMIGVGLGTLYAALTLGYIVRSFRTTVSPEIYFYAFWALSVALEVLRFVIFIIMVQGGSSLWRHAAERALLASRYAGCFAFFAAGLYSTGFRSEKTGLIVAFLLSAAVGLAAAMPINTGSYAVVLDIEPGYRGLHRAFFLILYLIGVADFLYAAEVKSEKSFRLIALGAALFLLGRWLLAARWHPAPMLVGFALLAAGSWLFVSKLHAYYLWQ